MYRYSQFVRLQLAMLILVLLSITGIVGYMYIEGYTLSEALHMTVITISTVGFQEVRPLSKLGRLFTDGLIILSFGTFAYAITAVSTYLIDGKFRKYLHELSRKKRIQGMEDHVIICGYGRNGKQIASDLLKMDQDFLIIESNEDAFEGDAVLLDHFLEGDATSDQVLLDAGIKRAKALITTLPEDADNVFVVLTAREMNRDLLIISRASVGSSYQKLRRAGANNVVMPDKVGGAYMATLVMKPDVVEFFTLLTGQADDISLEEITYESLPEVFKDKSIGDLEIRKRSGANILGLKNKDGDYQFNPTPDTIITEGSKLFVLGMSEQLEKLKEWK